MGGVCARTDAPIIRGDLGRWGRFMQGEELPEGTLLLRQGDKKRPRRVAVNGQISRELGGKLQHRHRVELLKRSNVREV